MSVLELSIGRQQELVGPLHSGRFDDEAVSEALARMAWTLLIEPADQVAGRLIAGLGARVSLEAVLVGDVEVAVGIEIAEGAMPDRARRTIRDAFDRWRPRMSTRAVVRAMEQAASLELSVALPDDEDWPEGFAALGPAAPVAMWIRGDRSRLAGLRYSVALVGARASTGYGEYVATEIAGGLAERGMTVVSGGAYGIDAASHRAALAADGMTAAFLAGGLDRYYPAGNAELLGRVADRGLVLAEVPPGVPPTRMRFLTRNRLLAASSAATVVVEAGVRSGSLNTANHALAIGRPVGVVPGPVTSPTSAGCHRLLREEQVTCVTSADDAIELAGGARRESLASYAATDADVVRLLDALGRRRGSTPDEAARSSGLAVSTVMGLLGALEVEGLVRRADSGWVRTTDAGALGAGGRR